MSMPNNSIVASSVSRLLGWRKHPIPGLAQPSASLALTRDAIATISHDLVDVQAPAGKLNNLQRSHIDLRTIVGLALDSISPDMAQRAHRLVMQLPDDAIWVHADATRLEQAFANLLINAARFTPDGGEILVTLERHGTHAQLRIRDSGIGIDASMLHRVFDLHVRATATRTWNSGSDIGLALVRELVEKHGGTVQAASAGLGFGSEFTVIVPVLWAAGPPLDPGAPQV
jgi:signal transduction histidine kinase